MARSLLQVLARTLGEVGRGPGLDRLRRDVRPSLKFTMGAEAQPEIRLTGSKRVED